MPENVEKGRRPGKKTVIIAICAALAVTAVALVAFWPRLAGAVGGRRTITLEVVFDDGSQMNYILSTGESYLGQALSFGGLIDGEEREDGYYVTSVAGIRADASRGERWVLYEGDEPAGTVLFKTPIRDGDVFRYVFEKS